MADHIAALDANASSRDDNATERRHFKHFLVKTRYQVQFLPLFLIGGLATLVTVVVGIYLRMLAVDDVLNSAAAMKSGGDLLVYDAFYDITWIALTGFGVFFVWVCGVALLLSHRVSGPMTALIACIEDLKRGQYELKRELRRGDELVPLHDALRDLGRELKNRAGGS